MKMLLILLGHNGLSKLKKYAATVLLSEILDCIVPKHLTIVALMTLV